MFKRMYQAFSPRERALLFFAAAVLVASGVALVALALGRLTKTVPARGGDYIEGVVGQPSYINPVLAESEIDRSMVKLLFANLPALAEKIDSSPDGLTWDVRLKENLVWQDGEKLTSDDVIFTIEKIQDPQSGSPLRPAWQGVAARRVSELELQLQLPAPYAFFSGNLADLFPVPKHLFADVPASNWRLSEYNLKPVGSGPYAFRTYDRRTDGFLASYELAASPSYALGKPLIESFGVRFFAHEDDLLRSFNAGQVDGIAGLDPLLLPRIERPYALYDFSTPSYYAVFLNQTRNAALKDPVARRALALAAPKDALIADVLGGYGIKADSPLPAAIASSTVLGSSTPSLDDIAAMLDAAGWKLASSTGVRVKTTSGVSTTLQAALLVPQVDFLVATARELQAAWAKIGFEADLTIAAPEDIAADAVKNRDYEMLLFGNILNPPEDLYPFWHSSERFAPGLNLSLYNNKSADALIESAREDTNPDTRAQKLAALKATIAGDNPAVFLYSPGYLYATTKALRGLEAGFIANPADRLDGVARWYVQTARVLK